MSLIRGLYVRICMPLIIGLYVRICMPLIIGLYVTDWYATNYWIKCDAFVCH